MKDRRSPWRLGSVFFTRGGRTPSGIHVGSTVAQLERKYGARLQPSGRSFLLTRRQSPHWHILFYPGVRQIAFGGEAVFFYDGCA